MYIVTVDDTRKKKPAKSDVQELIYGVLDYSILTALLIFCCRTIEKAATPNLTLLQQCNSFIFNLLHAFCFTFILLHKQMRRRKQEQTRLARI